MRTETTRIFTDLLSLHGYPAEPAPTPQPHQEGASMNLFKSLWLLSGLQSIDLRVGDEDERPFGRTYGNDVASKRLFGNPREGDDAIVVQRRSSVANDQRVAHC